MSSEQFDAPTREFFRRQFNLYDKDGSETISLADLASALRMCGMVPLESEIPPLQGEADQQNKGTVDFEGFCRAIFICMTQARTHHELKEAFKCFDPDERGVISQQELRFFMTTMGDALTDEEMNEFAEEMKAETDVDGNFVYSDLIQKLLPEFLRQ
jgi:calmodulin